MTHEHPTPRRTLALRASRSHIDLLMSHVTLETDNAPEVQQ